MAPRFDDRDARIVAERCGMRSQRPGPDIGDFVQRSDGSIERIANWQPSPAGVRIQMTTLLDFPFHLSPQGSMGHHPSQHWDHCPLGDAIDPAELLALPFVRKGCCWIEHHGNGDRVSTEVNCRVYMEV